MPLLFGIHYSTVVIFIPVQFIILLTVSVYTVFRLHEPTQSTSFMCKVLEGDITGDQIWSQMASHWK